MARCQLKDLTSFRVLCFFCPAPPSPPIHSLAAPWRLLSQVGSCSAVFLEENSGVCVCICVCTSICGSLVNENTCLANTLQNEPFTLILQDTPRLSGAF
uniref:Uncharacterized protein n=1 Tax=Poecilia reticulata TaxID=8081 RepID=A0A3P9PX32_POERE